MTKIGFKHSEETKLKMSKTRKGSKLSESHRIAIKASYNDELREKHRQIMLTKYEDPKERELQSIRMKAALDDTEVRIRMSEGQKNREYDPSQYEAMQEARRGFKATDETKEKIRLATMGNTSHLGCKQPPEAIEAMRQKRLEYWENTPNRDEHIGKIIAASHKKPNKTEIKLLKVLNSVSNEWDFVGNGQLMIAGKNPDYADVNGRKLLVELYGDYYHKGENPEDRINLFALYGYRTLIIWERELKDIETVKEKIKEFING